MKFLFFAMAMFTQLALADSIFECPTQYNDFKKAILKFENNIRDTKDEDHRLIFLPDTFPDDQPFIMAFRDCWSFYYEANIRKNKNEINHSLQLWNGCVSGLGYKTNVEVRSIMSCLDHLR